MSLVVFSGKLKRISAYLTFFAVTLPLSSLPAWTAQDAIISVDDAPIHEKPDLESPVLEFKKLGAPIRISGHAREGWFKIQSSKGNFGWIWQNDVLVPSSKTELESTNVDLLSRPEAQRRDRNPPRFSLRAEGLFFSAFNRTLSNSLGLGSYRIHPHFGGMLELAYTMQASLRIALRVQYLGLSESVHYHDIPYDIQQSSVPVLLGLDKDVFQGDSWGVGVGLYLGAATNSLTVTSTSLPPPNGFNITDFNFAFLLDVVGRYWMTQRLAFTIEGGMYGVPSKAIQLAGPFNGIEPFLNEQGNPRSIRPSAIGPQVGVGIQLNF